jgi:hypothetical protein
MEFGNLSTSGQRFKQASFWLIAAFLGVGIITLGIRLLTGMTWIDNIPARFECTLFTCIFVAVTAVVFLAPIVVGTVVLLRRREQG